LLKAVPADILELAGADDVEYIESLATEIQTWRDLALTPDPFAGLLDPRDGTSEWPASDIHVRHRAVKVERAKTLMGHIPSSSEAKQIVREQAKPLAGLVTEGREKLTMTELSLISRLVGSEIEMKQGLLDVATTEEALPVAIRLRDQLADTVGLFPTYEDLRRQAIAGGTEQKSRSIDCVVAGARKNPILEGRYMDAKNEAEPNEVTINRLLKILEETGDGSLQIRRVHRSRLEMEADQTWLNNFTHGLYGLKRQASDLHANLARLSASQITVPIVDIQQQLTAFKTGNDQNLESLRRQNLLSEADALRAITMERYITSQAQAALKAIADTKAKPPAEVRKALRSLTDDPLQRRYEREAKWYQEQQVGRQSLAAEVAPDPGFRRNCSESKKILDGGDHIAHPRASRLAKELHGIQFEQKHKTRRLERDEQGLVVAILTGKLAPLLAAHERVQAADAAGDVQVQQLKRDLPRQFTVISHFDLERSVKSLRDGIC
jgi:hypothetical protein